MPAIHTDAPEVIKIALAAFPDYTGRKFSVDTFTHPRRLISMWDGGSIDYFALVDIATCRTVELPQGIGELPALPLGTALVEQSIYRGKNLGCRIYVAPETLTPLLGDSPVELPWAQRVVLSATRGLKPSYNGIKNYRAHEARAATGISLADYEEAKTALIASKHLNKAGAITNAGRNAIGDVNLSSLAPAKHDRFAVMMGDMGGERFTHEANSPAVAESAAPFVAELAREIGVDSAEFSLDFPGDPAPVSAPAEPRRSAMSALAAIGAPVQISPKRSAFAALANA